MYILCQFKMEIYIPNLTNHKTLKTCNEMLKKQKNDNIQFVLS